MDNITFEIKDNSKKIDKILEYAENIVDIEIAIGLFAGSDPFEATKGWINENGSSDGKHPPSRPFVLPTFEANKKGMQKSIIGSIKRYENPYTFMPILANNMSDKIKARIINGKFKKLAKSTIERKGFSNPLIETWDMYNAITTRRLK